MLLTAEQIAKHINKSPSHARKVLAEIDAKPFQELSFGRGKIRLYDSAILPQITAAVTARAAANLERMRQHGNAMYAAGKLRRKRTRVEITRIDALERKVDALLAYFQISVPNGNGNDSAF